MTYLDFDFVSRERNNIKTSEWNESTIGTAINRDFSLDIK